MELVDRKGELCLSVSTSFQEELEAAAKQRIDLLLRIQCRLRAHLIDFTFLSLLLFRSVRVRDEDE